MLITVMMTLEVISFDFVVALNEKILKMKMVSDFSNWKPLRKYFD